MKDFEYLCISMKQALYLIIIICVVLGIAACTTESDRMCMRAGLDCINVRNRTGQSFTVADVQPYVTFFDEHGTPNDRLLAHYLLGLAYYDHHEAPMALQCYQKAADCADTTDENCDYAQLARVYGQMAGILYNQLLYQEELEYLDKATKYAWKDSDVLAAIMYTEEKVHVYRMLNKFDSVTYICQKVSDLYSKYGYKNYAARALSSGMRTLIAKKEYGKVKEYMEIYEKESGCFSIDNNIEKGREIYYNLKGLYYIGIGKTDSARYFFQKEISTAKDFNNQNAAAIELARYYQIAHIHDSATKYALYAYAMNDSMNAHRATKEVERMKAMYDYSRYQETARTESEKAAERILYIWICIGIILFLLLILTIATFVFHEIRQKSKRVEKQYRQSLATIEQANEDIKKLQLYETLNKEFISEKEKLIHEQESTIKELLQKEKTGQELASKDFKSTPIYRDFSKSIASGKDLDKSKWVDFQDKLFYAYPNFSELMNKFCDNMTDNEYRTCLLIRADFKPVSIGAALGINPSTMTQIRKNLHKTIFGKSGDSKDFDRLLKRIY